MTDTSTEPSLWHRALAALPDEDRTLSLIRGQMVRLRREELGVTQVDLATAAGTNQQTISRVERATMTPNDALRVAIAKALQMRAGELFMYADEMEGTP